MRLILGKDAELQGAPDPLLARLRRDLTFENPRYRDAKRYARWIGKNLAPTLSFYEEKDGRFRFPRGYAGTVVRLSRQMVGTTPEIDDRRRTLAPVPLRFQGRLRSYQEVACQAVLRRDFGVLEAGTGSGKTVMALAVIAARRQPTLVLVHTKELLYQWRDRIIQFLGIEPGLAGDGHLEIGPVTVGIVNTVRTHLAELTDRFGMLCVDECHRVPASLFTEVVTGFDCRYSLGLSATAFRRDGLDALIEYYLGRRVHRVATQHLQASGAVLRPRYLAHSTAFRARYRGDYQALLRRLVADPHRNQQIAADIVAAAKSGASGILVVSDRVEHCRELTRLLKKAGIDAGVLTGRLPADERRRIIDALHDGAIGVVIATLQLIGEGFDCPGLDTLFLTTPIKFTGRLQQVVGRILRPAPGKTATVHDYVDPVPVLRRSALARRRFFLGGP